ncbi:MAG: methyltransferase domain-containing protein [Planctomycetaceae bacterium]|nr:methyltransferase domain-containing protein [Planctomycetaceae bacterium]
MAYVHGYSKRETQRLYEQAEILEAIIHGSTVFGAGEKVLEAGCGVGAQTRLLVRRSPNTEFTCIDVSEDSLACAAQLKKAEAFENVTLKKASIYELPFSEGSFDHVFVCFVLEHLTEPVKALRELKRVLRSGGSATVIEGDHGSCFWHPETAASATAWNGLIRAQKAMGHDPTIGRKLTPLLEQAGLRIKTCSPAWLYADRLDRPLRDGMVDHIIVPMVQSAQEQILTDKLVDAAVYETGIKDLSRVDEIDEGTFFYTWFKAIAVNE